MKKIYLHQYLSKTGLFGGKRQIIDILHKGEIFVNGKKIKDAYFMIKPYKPVYWNDKKIECLPTQYYIIFNKPEGYLSSRLTLKDIEMTKKSIFDLLEDEKKLDDREKQTLFCVGRLDEDSSGLIIITNDGNLGNKITDPKSNIEKTYEAILAFPIGDADIAKMERGVDIFLEENGEISTYHTRPCRVERKGERLLITVTEGKKREVRRILEAFGNQVKSLKRISIGKILLDELKIEKGKYVFVEKKYISERI